LDFRFLFDNTSTPLFLRIQCDCRAKVESLTASAALFSKVHVFSDIASLIRAGFEME